MVKPKDARKVPHTARDSKGRFVSREHPVEELIRIADQGASLTPEQMRADIEQWAHENKDEIVRRVGAKSVDCCHWCYNAMKDRCELDRDCWCHKIEPPLARVYEEDQRGVEIYFDSPIKRYPGELYS